MPPRVLPIPLLPSLYARLCLLEPVDALEESLDGTSVVVIVSAFRVGGVGGALLDVEERALSFALGNAVEVVVGKIEGRLCKVAEAEGEGRKSGDA